MKNYRTLLSSALVAFTVFAGIQARADNMASIAIAPLTGVVTLAPRWAIGGSLAGFHFMAQDLSLGGGANQFYSIKGTAIPAGGDIAAFTHYIAASGAATNHVDIGSKLTPSSYSALSSADPDIGYGPVNFYFIHHKSSGDYFTVIVPSSGTASAVTDLKPMSGPGGPATLGASGYFGLTFAAANLGYGLDFFYYLRTDPVTGFTKFGTLDPSLLGTSADKFNLGMGGHNALEFTGSDVGYGVNKMYFLRLDSITGFTIFGTLDPVTGRASDIANLGSVYSTLTFIPGDVGFGSGQFYTTGAVNTTWQSVSFAAIADRTLIAGSFTVTPSASSGLPVTLTVVPGSTGTATISGPVAGVFTVTPTAGGIITLQATQAGQVAPTPFEFNMLRQSFTVSAVSSPMFSPAAGTFASAQSVIISSATSSASFAYTTDGSMPTETGGSVTHGTLYTTPVIISATTTLEAIAFETGLTDSAASTAGYTIQPAPANLAQLTNQTVTTGHTANFVASATGAPAPTFQWQVSTNGGATFTNLVNSAPYSGVTTSALAISNSSGLSGNQYRYVATNSAGSVTSNAITLTVVAAQFPSPSCIVVDSTGNLYVGDSSSNTIQKITAANIVSTVAGLTGSPGSTDGTGTSALFRQPGGITVNSTGTLYVADTGNSTIRQIAAGGIVTTLAGSATNQSYHDGTGTAAFFNMSVGISIDTSGNLYIADANNEVIRKIAPGAIVTTFAGTNGALGTTDGTGAAARFSLPSGSVVDNSSGNIYIADTNNNTIRKITPFGVVTTLAGLAATSGSSDGTGNIALFNLPSGLATDSSGNIYVADTANSTIRKITPSGTVTTLAGMAGAAGLMDGTGINAEFNQPKDLTVDSSGNVYVADTGNAAIRKITPAGVVTTLTVSTAAASASTPASTAPKSTSTNSGGGAFDDWFIPILATLALVRRRSRKK